MFVKRILKIHTFVRWMRKTELTDKALVKAVEEMEQGLIDADLGGNVYKKRVPLPHRGKRGSTRTLVASNMGTRWFFMYGLEKNDKENITHEELDFLKEYARILLRLTDAAIDVMIKSEKLFEVSHHAEKE
jgi:hypothetical protein